LAILASAAFPSDAVQRITSIGNCARGDRRIARRNRCASATSAPPSIACPCRKFSVTRIAARSARPAPATAKPNNPL
jgi:uncharacterized protein (DUF3084 family)